MKNNHKEAPKLPNTPFKNVLKEVKVVPPREMYEAKCLEYASKSEKLREAIWEVTQGNPCARCNRPEKCKTRIYTKKGA